MKLSESTQRPNARGVAQVARERGIGFGEDLLSQALSVSEEQSRSARTDWGKVKELLSRVQRGVESPDELQTLALVCHCSTETVRHKLQQLCPGKQPRAYALVAHALGSQADRVAQELGSLFSADQTIAHNAAVSLASLCEQFPATAAKESAQPVAPRHAKRPVPTEAPARAQAPGAPTAPAQNAYKVYAKSAALCVELDRFLRPNPEWLTHTVLLEGAKASGDTPASGYQWQEKIRFQLTQNELPLFAAFVLGQIPECRFSGHGRDHTKVCELQVRENGATVRLSERRGSTRRTILVPISDPDRFWIMSIVLQAQRANLPLLSDMALLEMSKHFLHAPATIP